MLMHTIDPPLPMLAKTWNGKQDLSGMAMSEKLDGVRAVVWDGRLWSRTGKPFHAPKQVRDILVPFNGLDGELYAGRGQFHTVTSIVRKKEPDAVAWGAIKFKAFGIIDPVSKEYYHASGVRAVNNAFIETVQQYPVFDTAAAVDFAADIIEQGGEGAIVRSMGDIPYRAGKRVGELLKLKQFIDGEATIVGHSAGRGKYAGLVGALVCELPDGTQFNVGSGMTDKQRASPHQYGLLTGAVITYRCMKLTPAGVPREPRLIAIRDYE